MTPERRSDSAGFWYLVGSDIDAALHYAAGFYEARKVSLARRLSVLFMPGLLCCVIYRLAHRLWQHGWRRCALLLSRGNYVLHKAAIAPSCSIGAGMYLPHTVGVIFQAHAGRGLTLYTNCQVVPQRFTDPFGAVPDDAPRLGDEVTIGAYAVVCGPLCVGDGARVGPAVALGSGLPRQMTAVSRLRMRAMAAAGPLSS